MVEQSSRLKERFTIHRQLNPQCDAETSDAERRPEHKRCQKLPTVVAKRNARERTRVHTVNQAFVTLKFHLPSLRSHTKRVSKLKILNAAICYIDSLVDLLRSYDASVAAIAIPSERSYRTVNADRSVIREPPFPYMQSILDCPSYLSTHVPQTQNFMMNAPFLLPSAYQ